MKKILFSLSILSILFITSCGKDDGGDIQIGLSGTLTYDGNAISITDGLFGEHAEDGSYAATFFLADGPLSYDASTDEASFQGEILISVIIFSQGDSFQSGVYSLDLSGNKGALVLVADANNAANGGAFASGGTVNITGSGNVYTLTFDVDIDTDITLTGSATGGFEIIDLSSVQ
ncbi:hypothetical protein [Ekhidna sp.]|uniref:hypothetical protein n=1 Tax=Ekhidna sp. TaxID=2608089 RepID=UPI003518E54B